MNLLAHLATILRIWLNANYVQQIVKLQSTARKLCEQRLKARLIAVYVAYKPKGKWGGGGMVGERVGEEVKCWYISQWNGPRRCRVTFVFVRCRRAIVQRRGTCYITSVHIGCLGSHRKKNAYVSETHIISVQNCRLAIRFISDVLWLKVQLQICAINNMNILLTV